MVFDKIRQMIADQLSIDSDSIQMDSDILKDIGLDSLDIVELIMATEDEWGIIVEDDDVQSFKTVRDVVSYIENKI